MAARTVRVPCEPGDTVWGIDRHYGKTRPRQGTVSRIFLIGSGAGMKPCITLHGVCTGEWGKEIFASREKAIEAIQQAAGHASLKNSPG